MNAPAFGDFYNKHLAAFGPSAQGVGWKNDEAQRIRFKQLYKLFPDQTHFSVNDLGCGVGDFVSFLKAQGKDVTYWGYDLMPEMIVKAKEKYRDQTNANFQCIKNASEMQVSDYTVASGIFNIRFEATDEALIKSIHETLGHLDDKSQRGFAFNVLSKYSDVEYRKKELYYADPLHLFDYCKKHFSKNVALLHDYDQYDFTIIVRK
jgi:SAM-dependent methyltransferase